MENNIFLGKTAKFITFDKSSDFGAVCDDNYRNMSPHHKYWCSEGYCGVVVTFMFRNIHEILLMYHWCSQNIDNKIEVELGSDLQFKEKNLIHCTL